MTVVPLPLTANVPDAAIGGEPDGAPPVSRHGFATALAEALGNATDSLARADAAERAFASGRGGLQEMVLERAQADVALSLAGAAASRVAQSLSTILGMQI